MNNKRKSNAIADEAPYKDNPNIANNLKVPTYPGELGSNVASVPADIANHAAMPGISGASADAIVANTSASRTQTSTELMIRTRKFVADE